MLLTAIPGSLSVFNTSGVVEQLQPCRDARFPQRAALGGAINAGHDHAPWSLDSDAVIMQAQGALKELTKLLPDRAVRILEDRTEEVAVSDLDYSSRATSLTTPSLRFS